MNVSVSKGFLADFAGESVACGVFEPESKDAKPAIPVALQRIDAKVGGLLAASVNAGEFTGKQGAVSVYRVKGIPARLVLIVGLGKEKEFNAEAVRQAGARCATAARDLKCKTLAFCLDSAVAGAVDSLHAGKLLAEGSVLGLYRFQEYKREKDDAELSSLTLITANGPELPAAGAAEGAAIADSANLIRDLNNKPGNIMAPLAVADAACGLAKKFGFSCAVLNKNDLEAEKMGGILAVASGSANPPCMVCLEYRGAAKGKKPIVLIGKGITFDTGGISLKTRNDMGEMKYDKSGALAVLGAFTAAARLKLSVNAVGLLPLAENMPGGRAFRPGDIIRTRSGKTVENISSDAEGRLILCDAIDYAKKFEPSAIVDIATLTGACMVALGNEASGLMGNDDALQKLIESSGEESGERVWRLPMWKEYDAYVKSEIADVRNLENVRGAGAIAGAKFLEIFVPEGLPWAHVDMGGVDNNAKPGPYLGIGATGYGVRLLSSLLKKLE